MNVSLEIKEHLTKLYEAGGRRLEPSAVVKDAESETSPLHKFFEWDDAKAAFSYRIEVAREIIRSVRITVVNETKEYEVPEYIHTRGQEPGYQTIVDIRSQKQIALEALRTEFQCVANALRRAREIANGLGLRAEVESLMTQVGAREVIIMKRARLNSIRSQVKSRKPTKASR